jgi:hypothetical protein
LDIVNLSYEKVSFSFLQALLYHSPLFFHMPFLFSLLS